MNTSHVVRVFSHIWPLYSADPLEVELLEFWHGPDSHRAPFTAAVVWDSDCWAILADVQEGPGRLLEILFHELKHVLNQDVSKSGYGRGVLRKAALGTLVQVPVEQTVATSVQETKSTPAARHREKLADDWSETMAAVWWPCIVACDGASDEVIGWTVKQYHQYQNRRS